MTCGTTSLCSKTSSEGWRLPFSSTHRRGKRTTASRSRRSDVCDGIRLLPFLSRRGKQNKTQSDRRAPRGAWNRLRKSVRTIALLIQLMIEWRNEAASTSRHAANSRKTFGNSSGSEPNRSFGTLRRICDREWPEGQNSTSSWFPFPNVVGSPSQTRNKQKIPLGTLVLIHLVLGLRSSIIEQCYLFPLEVIARIARFYF